MLLKRWGANRNSGWTPIINNKEFSASWNKTESLVQLSFKRINGENGQYNYEIDLTIEEISKILNVISEDGLKHSHDIVSQKLGSSSRSLLRLIISTAGLSLSQMSGKS